jgi:hypothetical protein
MLQQRVDARLGERLESEATALTAALHAFMMFHFARHQTSEETDVEPADLPGNGARRRDFEQ